MKKRFAKVAVLRRGSTDSWIPRLGMIGLGVALLACLGIGGYYMINHGTQQMQSVGTNAYTSASNSSAFGTPAANGGGAENNGTLTPGSVGA